MATLGRNGMTAATARPTCEGSTSPRLGRVVVRRFAALSGACLLALGSVGAVNLPPVHGPGLARASAGLPQVRRADRADFAPGLVQGLDRGRFRSQHWADEGDTAPAWNPRPAVASLALAPLAAFDAARFTHASAPVPDLQRIALAEPERAAPAPTPLDLGVVGLMRAADQGESVLSILERVAVGGGSDPMLRFGQMRVRQSVIDTVLHASIATDVDPVYMMALADKESSFAPAVRASRSSAEGLFQFLEGTWFEAIRTFGPRHGLTAEARLVTLVDGRPTVTDPQARARLLALRRDPFVSAVLAAEMKRRDATRVAAAIGRPLTEGEFYLMHFLGRDGATRFLRLRDQEPNSSAAQAFPAAARANRSLFYDLSGRRAQPVTIAVFAQRLDDMIARRVDRYGIIRSAAGSAAPQPIALGFAASER